MLKGFKDFIMRGNVIDLAVAFVIGLAFVNVVTAFTKGVIQPLIDEILGGGVDGGTITLSPGNVIDIGGVINAIITFIITAAVVYFIFVLPMNKMKERQEAKAGGPAEAEETEIDVLKQIRDQLNNTQG